MSQIRLYEKNVGNSINDLRLYRIRCIESAIVSQGKRKNKNTHKEAIKLKISTRLTMIFLWSRYMFSINKEFCQRLG